MTAKVKNALLAEWKKLKPEELAKIKADLQATLTAKPEDTDAKEQLALLEEFTAPAPESEKVVKLDEAAVKKLAAERLAASGGALTPEQAVEVARAQLAHDASQKKTAKAE